MQIRNHCILIQCFQYQGIQFSINLRVHHLNVFSYEATQLYKLSLKCNNFQMLCDQLLLYWVSSTIFHICPCEAKVQEAHNKKKKQINHMTSCVSNFNKSTNSGYQSFLVHIHVECFAVLLTSCMYLPRIFYTLCDGEL